MHTQIPSGEFPSSADILDGKEADQPELSRVEKLINGCDLLGAGLEIGPSYNPVVPKKSGYRVDTLDHADAAQLREKYRNHDIDLSMIEEVTFVWHGEPLDELTQKRDHYDWIIASHVIEHTTDLISFLIQCEKMLKVGGILSLAVPDHRFCFDVFRPASTCGEVVQAFLEKRRTHSAAAIFDHFSLAAMKNGNLAWSKESAGDYALMHESIHHAQAVLESTQLSSEYMDIHNWRFTPASFRLIMIDVLALGYTSMAVKSFSPTSGFEFFCQLEKRSAINGMHVQGASRLELLLEAAQESRFLA